MRTSLLAALALAASVTACIAPEEGELMSFELRQVDDLSTCLAVTTFEIRTVYADDGTILSRTVEGGQFDSLESVTEPSGDDKIVIDRRVDGVPERLTIFIPAQEDDGELLASVAQSRPSCTGVYFAKVRVSGR